MVWEQLSSALPLAAIQPHERHQVPPPARTGASTNVLPHGEVSRQPAAQHRDTSRLITQHKVLASLGMSAGAQSADSPGAQCRHPPFSFFGESFLALYSSDAMNSCTINAGENGLPAMGVCFVHAPT